MYFSLWYATIHDTSHSFMVYHLSENVNCKFLNCMVHCSWNQNKISNNNELGNYIFWWKNLSPFIEYQSLKKTCQSDKIKCLHWFILLVYVIYSELS